MTSEPCAKYLQISNALRLAIKTSKVAPGEQLPSARQLASELSSNRHTVMAAFAELIAEGWVISKQRSGYFVNHELPIDSSQRCDTPTAKDSGQSFNWNFRKQPPSSYQTPAANYRYNFAGGTPDISLFPFNELKSYLNDAMSRPNLVDLNYGNNQGFLPLINQIKIYLRRARSLPDREVIITNGSQEALYILSQLLLSPHDVVATEAMGYRPAWNAFKSSGAQLAAIEQDQYGMIPQSLTRAIARHKIKLIYLTPLHQYPTTVTLPISRRMAIYNIAARHNIAIIEDDYDHEFHYRCQPLAPMAADDPRGLVIYLSTFSKVMFPGVRIGFIAVGKELAQAIVDYRTLLNHKVSIPLQDAVARWMGSGAFERYLRKVTKIYHQRRDFMICELEKHLSLGNIKYFSKPDGGMAIWVNVGQGAQQLVKSAHSKGIYLQDESRFQLESHLNTDSYIRLGFAGMAEQQIKIALKLLFNHKNC